jgi:hypothetical protein
MIARNTEWRQGSVITQESFSTLCPAEKGQDTHAIVISHDCDLPNENEELVEIILGPRIPDADSHFTHARHIRRLHIAYQIKNSSKLAVIELTHARRQCFSKKELSQKAAPDLDFILSCEEKRVLKQWLSARYGRPAFPNAFEARLKKDKNLEKKLSRILSPANSQLVGIFFDLGEERTIDLPPEQPYCLRISIVYDNIGGPAARKVAEECALNIKKLFHETFGTPSHATELILESCEAVADTLFSLADIRKVDQCRLEYISLRENPHGDFLPVGETPI